LVLTKPCDLRTYLGINVTGGFALTKPCDLRTYLGINVTGGFVLTKPCCFHFMFFRPFVREVF
jgi:hypothetical protein